VRLESGALAVFSPVALTDDVKQKVSEMGEVKYIAALDAEVSSSSPPKHLELSLTKSTAPHLPWSLAQGIP
jgi:hypothetical protein